MKTVVFPDSVQPGSGLLVEVLGARYDRAMGLVVEMVLGAFDGGSKAATLIEVSDGAALGLAKGLGERRCGLWNPFRDDAVSLKTTFYNDDTALVSLLGKPELFGMRAVADAEVEDVWLGSQALLPVESLLASAEELAAAIREALDEECAA